MKIEDGLMDPWSPLPNMIQPIGIQGFEWWEIEFGKYKTQILIII